MIIKSIEAENFGKLEKLNMEFKPGINVITGDNESGKSSVTRFIRYMLYGFTSRAGDISKNDKKKYSPWSSLDIKGEMKIETEKGSFTLRREQLSKTAPFCILDESGSPVYPGLPAGDAFLGVDAETYDKTAMISAGDVFFSEPETLSGAIKNMVFSADSEIDSDSVLKKLENAKKEILGKTQKSGILYELRNEKTRLEQRKKESLEKRNELAEIKTHLDRTKKRIEENLGILDGLKKERNNLRAKYAYEKRERIEKARKSAEKAKKAYEDKNLQMSVDGFVPDRKYLSDMNDAILSLMASQDELNSARHERSHAESRTALLYGNTKQMKFNSLIEEAGKEPEELMEDVEALKNEEKSKKKTGVILACLVITLPISFIFFSKAKKARKKLDELAEKFECKNFEEFEELLSSSREAFDSVKEAKEELEEAQKTLDEKTEERKAAADKLCGMLDKTGCKTSVSDTSLIAEKAKEHIRKLSDDITELDELKKNELSESAQLEGLLESEPDMEKLEILANAYDETIPLRGQQQVEKEFDFYTRATDTLNIQKQEYEKKAAVISENTEESDELEAKFQMLKAEIEKLSKKHAALETASDAIKEAYDEMRSNVSPILTENASKLFEALTDGKYESLYVDNELKLGFLEKGSAEYRNIEYLSSGALDAAYLCLRIALSEDLYTEKPVLIFDDAFSKLDDGRLKKALEIMKVLAKDYQIIILSCLDREKNALGKAANCINM